MEHHEHQLPSPEVTYVAETKPDLVRIIKRVTIILSIVTLVELAMGYWIYTMHHSNPTLILFVKGVITILSLAKAFYIVSYFMHLGDEIRSFAMTIVIPLLLFIWFIIAFLWDGASWRNLKNTDGGSRPATEHVAPAPAATPGHQQ